jgi:hypothetical protein
MSDRSPQPAATVSVAIAAIDCDRRLARIITGNGWRIQRQFLVFSRFFRDFFGFWAFFRRFSGFSKPRRPRRPEKRASFALSPTPVSGRSAVLALCQTMAAPVQ